MQLLNFVRLPTKFINGYKLDKELGERGESIYRKTNILPHLSQTHSRTMMKNTQIFNKFGISSQTPLWFAFKAGHCESPATTVLGWLSMKPVCAFSLAAAQMPMQRTSQTVPLPSQDTQLWGTQHFLPTAVRSSHWDWSCRNHLPTLKGNWHSTTKFSPVLLSTYFLQAVVNWYLQSTQSPSD